MEYIQDNEVRDWGIRRDSCLQTIQNHEHSLLKNFEQRKPNFVAHLVKSYAIINMALGKSRTFRQHFRVTHQVMDDLWRIFVTMLLTKLILS